MSSNLFEKKIKLSAKLENIFGKPMDVVVHRDKKRPVEKEAFKGIKIWLIFINNIYDIIHIIIF